MLRAEGVGTDPDVASRVQMRTHAVCALHQAALLCAKKQDHWPLDPWMWNRFWTTVKGSTGTLNVRWMWKRYMFNSCHHVESDLLAPTGAEPVACLVETRTSEAALDCAPTLEHCLPSVFHGLIPSVP
ncbi:unnamed protein product [Durusdinium trenchii]|uniref:Uncharacterized protein n=1 Tax=Durusdinium trenchii TaxID=1381693 RepID=A0ABP0RPU9_9DINO